MNNLPPLFEELPYIPDSCRLFDAVADRRWAVFLDSGHPASRAGRFDIISCDPMATLVTRGPETEVEERGEVRVSGRDPFDLLREALGPAVGGDPALPFCGGAIGYFSYDLARRLERLPQQTLDEDGLPEMAVGIYDWALMVDHLQQRSFLVGQGRDDGTRNCWRQLVERFSKLPARRPWPAFRAAGEISSNMTREHYGEAFSRVQSYIREGDCYQVNLAQRFSVPVEGSPWVAYQRLRELNPAPFSAFLGTPEVQVLSSSPERFLQVRQGEVETRPIKGTLPRGDTPESDRARAAALENSAKDRAENLMIVDLLRNDLSKTCALGSVKVSRLFDVETFATVHHLVTTVEGKLAAGEDALSLLRGCFPGGSITGAPKLRAMEIIEELEPHRRGVYCGAIGYLSFDGSMDSNIAIRTLVHRGGVMRFWGGGGLVADSVPETEYQETFHKVEALRRLFV
jgi:para-aminobenzoate synthetase component 1